MNQSIASVNEQSAAVLAHPLRRRLLEEWSHAASPAEIAERIGESRQKVNYHAHALADAGFLEKAGKRRKRNMWEQRYVRSTRAFVLSPEILGPLAADASTITDRASSQFAIALQFPVAFER